MLILYYKTFAWLLSIHDPTHEKSRTARCQTQIIKSDLVDTFLHFLSQQTFFLKLKYEKVNYHGVTPIPPFFWDHVKN